LDGRKSLGSGFRRGDGDEDILKSEASPIKRGAISSAAMRLQHFSPRHSGDCFKGSDSGFSLNLGEIQ
jgi:hypothetical protein